MKKIVLLAAAGALTLSGCNKGTPLTEDLIQELDVEIDGAVNEARYSISMLGQEQFLDDHEEWRQSVQKACESFSCAQEMYRERLKYLSVSGNLNKYHQLSSEAYEIHTNARDEKKNQFAAMSSAEKRRLSIEACEHELNSIAFTYEMNYHTRQREPVRALSYSYHTEHTHPNWKARYGDNYIHSYMTFRVSRGSISGDPQFRLCIVSKDNLEVIDLVHTDIVA